MNETQSIYRVTQIKRRIHKRKLKSKKNSGKSCIFSSGKSYGDLEFDLFEVSFREYVKIKLIYLIGNSCFLHWILKALKTLRIYSFGCPKSL